MKILKNKDRSFIPSGIYIFFVLLFIPLLTQRMQLQWSGTAKTLLTGSFFNRWLYNLTMHFFMLNGNTGRSEKWLRNKSFGRPICTLSLLIVLFGLTVALYSCDNRASSVADKDKLLVLTTLFPTYDFARHIAGDKASVEMLLPPGVEPHSFEPKPQDIARLQKADIFIFTGSNMEPWVDKILKGLDNKGLVVVDASKGLKFIHSSNYHNHRDLHLESKGGHSHDETVDPHVWLDFDNAQKMADNIFTALSTKDPKNQTFYKKNLDKYKTMLYDLDNRYKSGLSNCQKRVFISGGHRIFGYLASRYNLRHLSAYGISPDSQPSAKAIARLSKEVKKEQLGHVFFEELMSPRVAETISKETGAELLLLRGAHNLGKEEFLRGVTFIDIMDENLRALKKGLQCP